MHIFLLSIRRAKQCNIITGIYTGDNMTQYSWEKHISLILSIKFLLSFHFFIFRCPFYCKNVCRACMINQSFVVKHELLVLKGRKLVLFDLSLQKHSTLNDKNKAYFESMITLNASCILIISNIVLVIFRVQSDKKLYFQEFLMMYFNSCFTTWCVVFILAIIGPTISGRVSISTFVTQTLKQFDSMFETLNKVCGQKRKSKMDDSLLLGASNLNHWNQQKIFMLIQLSV